MQTQAAAVGDDGVAVVEGIVDLGQSSIGSRRGGIPKIGTGFGESQAREQTSLVRQRAFERSQKIVIAPTTKPVYIYKNSPLIAKNNIKIGNSTSMLV
jgi:hypothetical protein